MPFTDVTKQENSSGRNSYKNITNHVGTYAIQGDYNKMVPVKYENSIEDNNTNKSITSYLNPEAKSVTSVENIQNNCNEMLNLNVVNQIQQTLSNKGINHNFNELREAVGTVIQDLIMKGKLGNIVKQEDLQNNESKKCLGNTINSYSSSAVQNFNSSNVTTNKDTVNLLEDNDHLFENYYDTGDTQNFKSEDKSNNYMARFLKKNKGNGKPVPNCDFKPISNVIPKYDSCMKGKENFKQNIQQSHYLNDQKFYSNSEIKPRSTHNSSKDHQSSSKKPHFPINLGNKKNEYNSPMKDNNKNPILNRNTTNKKLNIMKKVEETRSKSLKPSYSRAQSTSNLKYDFASNHNPQKKYDTHCAKNSGNSQKGMGMFQMFKEKAHTDVYKMNNGSQKSYGRTELKRHR